MKKRTQRSYLCSCFIYLWKLFTNQTSIQVFLELWPNWSHPSGNHSSNEICLTNGIVGEPVHWSTAPHCTTLHYIALNCTSLYCITLHLLSLHWTSVPCTIHYTALNCLVLHFSELNIAALHCCVLYTTALHCSGIPVTGSGWQLFGSGMRIEGEGGGDTTETN